jgi:transposase
MALKSWQVSDPFWEQFSRLIPRPVRDPDQVYQRKPGGGRKRVNDRDLLEGMVFCLRTGCQWQAIPRQYGSPATIHRRFLEWVDQGVFEAVWQAGLAAYDELAGLEWEWQSIDGSVHKAPLGGEATGPNPWDRGKKRRQAPSRGGWHWGPLSPRRHRRERAGA